jgi:hypothetical protein
MTSKNRHSVRKIEGEIDEKAEVRKDKGGEKIYWS